MEEIGHAIYYMKKLSRKFWKNEWQVKSGAGQMMFEGTRSECLDYLASKRREACR